MLYLATQYFAPNDLIVRKGDIDERMYFIEKGTCNATIDDSGRFKRLNAGNFFGEGAVLIKKFRREINVVAVTWVEAITLTYFNFQDLLQKYPQAKQHISSWMKQHMNIHQTIRQSFYEDYADSLEQTHKDDNERIESMEEELKTIIKQNQLIIQKLAMNKSRSASITKRQDNQENNDNNQ